MKQGPSKRNLCFDCGLCCDGTLFSYVNLEDNDSKQTLAPLSLKSHDGQDFFLQPCPAYTSGRCSIYPSRPSLCRKYRCTLLRSCDEGQTTEVKALALIKEAISIRDRVRVKLEAFVKVDGPTSFPRLYQLMHAKLNGMNAEERKRVDAQMMLDVGSLRVLLAKRFESSSSKPTTNHPDPV